MKQEAGRVYASSFIGSNPGINVLPKEAIASPGKTFPEVDQVGTFGYRNPGSQVSQVTLA